MDFSGYIIYLFNFGVAAAAVLSFVVIMYAGIKLLTSAGNPTVMSESKKKIKDALLGLLVALLSYLLLTTINPSLVLIKGTSFTGNTSGGGTTGTTVTSGESFTFTEIPIGTLVESILTANSTAANGLPCYGYETNTYDSNGNIIIGNIIDRNKDRKIDEKDIYLDQDAFYCIQNLNDAIRGKIEIQLKKLIEELSSLMKSGCSCSNVYDGSFPPNPYARVITPTGGKCNCPFCTSYCELCGQPREGCTALSNNPITNAELNQYKYDACSNRRQIDCKRQEIKQLLDGTKPDDICYEKGFISETAPTKGVLSISTAMMILSSYRTYISVQLSALEAAEKQMKDNYGEKLSLAELNELEATSNYVSVAKSSSGSNITRYCKEYNCNLANKDKVLGISNLCSSGKVNTDGNVCRSSDYYLYDGDGATFYYSSAYNNFKEKNEVDNDTSDNKCSVAEEDISKGMYTGVIPIGEVVDETEAFGDEAARRLGKAVQALEGIYSSVSSIYDVPDGCSADSCRLEASNCCSRPSCYCDVGCCCTAFWPVSCYPAVPGACSYKNYADYIIGKCQTKAYVGCDEQCLYWPRTSVKNESQYFACPFGTFCNLVKNIYQTRNIESSCYEETMDEKEAADRKTKVGKVGYLQQFQTWIKSFNDLSGLTNLSSKFNDINNSDAISSACSSYMIDPSPKYLTCDDSLSAKPVSLKGRFTLLSLLTLSRERMTGCVQGYSYSYKNDLLEARVFSCQEGINLTTSARDKLTILYNKNDPYPQKLGANTYSCYPLNSSKLSKGEQEQCFVNKDKYDSAEDPEDEGCQNYIRDYMDNYYCCE